MEDETMGAEELNASKIFLSTLSFGLAFSVMLSRALFLNFSVGGPYTTHINGYLHCIMLFYMAGVEIAIALMYLFFANGGSAEAQRGLTYIALLSNCNLLYFYNAKKINFFLS